MADKYLNLTGLTYLWDKIKTYIQNAIPSAYAGSATAGGVANKTAAIPFGKVDSSSTSTAFTATIDGITELTDGVCCYLMNGKVTSADGWTLNINGLGAKPVYSTLAATSRTTTIFNVNYTMLFVYNSTRVSGGCWDIFYGYDSNTNTIGYQIRTNSLSLPVSGATYRYRLLFTSADGKKYVPANTSTSTNATSKRDVNQTPINPFGHIAYYGYTTAVSANSNPGSTYLWEQYAITLGYSFNRTGAALTLATWNPVYLKCAPQSDGSAIIDATTPYVQVLPSTADGKIYIFLGIAYSATQIELTLDHPIYYYSNGAIRRWTNAEPIPTKVSDLTNDSGYITGITSSDVTIALGYTPYNSTNPDGYTSNTGTITGITMNGVSKGTSGVVDLGTVLTSFTETDPTVPSWAKASSKPSYTASEVGALPDTTAIPTKISDLTNDQIYNLGTVTVSGQGIFDASSTASDIIAMWNRGFCGVTLTVNSKQYWAFKERIISYNNMDFYAFVGYEADIGADVTTGNVLFGVTAQGVGMFTVTTDMDYEAVSLAVSNIMGDYTYVERIDMNGDNYYPQNHVVDLGTVVTQETDPTVPAWAKASTKPTYTASEVGALAKTGGQVTGDITLYVASGNSPAIIFQRGTLTDNFNDWKIYDKSGFLYFAQRGNGSSDFGDIGYIDTGGVLRSFTIPWGSVTGKPTIPTKTSDLTNDSGFLSSVDAYDVTYEDETGWYTGTDVGNALYELATAKQDKLTSGTNIKTINNQSLLGSGNISISGGGGGTQTFWYGETNTSPYDATKVVTTSTEDFALNAGNTVKVYFNAATDNRTTSISLNVDDTGAVAAKINGSTTWPANIIPGYTAMDFTYDGQYFIASSPDYSLQCRYAPQLINTSIAAGSTTATVSINAKASGSTPMWYDVKGFIQTYNSKTGTYAYTPFTDFTHQITTSNAIYITLGSAQSNTIYFAILAPTYEMTGM